MPASIAPILPDESDPGNQSVLGVPRLSRGKEAIESNGNGIRQGRGGCVNAVGKEIRFKLSQGQKQDGGMRGEGFQQARSLSVG